MTDMNFSHPLADRIAHGEGNIPKLYRDFARKTCWSSTTASAAAPGPAQGRPVPDHRKRLPKGPETGPPGRCGVLHGLPDAASDTLEIGSVTPTRRIGQEGDDFGIVVLRLSRILQIRLLSRYMPS